MPPRKPHATPDAATAPNAAQEAEYNDRETEVLSSVRSLLEKPGSGEVDVVASVFRIVPIPGKMLRDARVPWLFDCPWTDLETLRPKLQGEPYNGGRFRVHVRCNRLSFAQYDMEIEPLPGTKPYVPTPLAATYDAPQTERIDRIERLLESLVTRVATPAAPVAVAPTMKETIETLVAMQALLPKDPPNIGLAMFEKGMELALKFGGGGGEGPTGFMDLAKEALQAITPALAPALAGMAKNFTPPAQKNALAPAAGNPAPLPLRPVSPAKPASQDASAAGAGFLPPALAEAMTFLVAKAAEGAQPDLFVDWLLEHVPPMAFEHLESQDDPLAYLESLFPAITPHRDWFGALIENLYEPEQLAPPMNADGGGNEPMRVQ